MRLRDGIGITIARQIVVEKHSGSLSCNSELGKGTEFAILIPIRDRDRNSHYMKILFSYLPSRFS
ncbi:ATP-binding protein [Iningainema tapete]|uniref:ATP-binding protein n=1 Tax=Iningainema tapete BLCC-T55 TaxID=2748662 RepID=A0A8J7CB73_9CYAN|nr:ATP-binding protein [Iningainema tapete]MBD2778006.1 ATP-binding protein [Iningainema tapete BLCC-T55]